MIIGENTDQYYGYEEESYDYLFKKKQGAPSPRQQKKAERKVAKPAPRPGSFKQKRQDKKAGIIPKKRLIMGNFGLFNKNKKREEAAKATATAAQDAVATPDADNLPTAPPVDDTWQDPQMSNPSEASMPSASEENSETAEPENGDGQDYNESSYDDPAVTSKSDTKTSDKGKEAKSSGPGVWFGWGFLGLTVGVIIYTVYKLDKMEARLPDNNHLHPKY